MRRAGPTEPALVRRLLIGTCLAFLGVFVVAPVVVVLGQASSGGLAPYLAAITTADSWAALQLTLLTAAIVVPLNTLFGIAAAWALTRFRFPGRALILSLIDLPLAVSPVVSGLVFVLLLGRSGLLGPWLSAHGLKVIFDVPGIVLATAFVTFPLVARELIPVMEAQGREEEEAARLLGAGGLAILRRVTLPNVKWGLLYGAILCNARAMGEFGAVSVVSGHIRGETNTLPLHVEVLYNEYDFQGAFAVASLLLTLATLSIGARALVEWASARGWAPLERRP